MRRGTTTKDMDLDQLETGEIARRLQAYAGARLSPSAWASLRMRAEVLERGRELEDAHGRRAMPWSAPFRRLAMVGLIAVLAVMAGGSAAVAATPGGPLYGTRIWIETALLPASGPARTTAQEAQLNERVTEFSGAVQDGNTSGAGAAADAYGTEVDQAVANAAQSRAELLQLRTTISRHLAHLQTLVKPNEKSDANLKRLIAQAQAALADIDQQLAALH